MARSVHAKRVMHHSQARLVSAFAGLGTEGWVSKVRLSEQVGVTMEASSVCVVNLKLSVRAQREA